MRKEMMMAAEEVAKERFPSQSGSQFFHFFWTGADGDDQFEWMDLYLKDFCSFFCYNPAQTVCSSIVAPQRPLLMEYHTLSVLFLLFFLFFLFLLFLLFLSSSLSFFSFCQSVPPEFLW